MPSRGLTGAGRPRIPATLAMGMALVGLAVPLAALVAPDAPADAAEGVTTEVVDQVVDTVSEEGVPDLDDGADMDFQGSGYDDSRPGGQQGGVEGTEQTNPATDITRVTLAGYGSYTVLPGWVRVEGYRTSGVDGAEATTTTFPADRTVYQWRDEAGAIGAEAITVSVGRHGYQCDGQGVPTGLIEERMATLSQEASDGHFVMAECLSTERGLPMLCLYLTKPSGLMKSQSYVVRDGQWFCVESETFGDTVDAAECTRWILDSFSWQ